MSASSSLVWPKSIEQFCCSVHCLPGGCPSLPVCRYAVSGKESDWDQALAPGKGSGLVSIARCVNEQGVCVCVWLKSKPVVHVPLVSFSHTCHMHTLDVVKQLEPFLSLWLWVHMLLVHRS